MVQGGQDRADAAQCGHAVGQAEGRQRGRPVRVTGDRREPAHRLGQRSEARPLRVRPELPKAGDAREHGRDRAACDQENRRSGVVAEPVQLPEVIQHEQSDYRKWQ